MSLSPGEGGGDVVLNMNHFNSDEEEEEEDGNLVYIPCKVIMDTSKSFRKYAVFQPSYFSCQCLGRDVIVLIDTGCRLNLISSLTVDRLG